MKSLSKYLIESVNSNIENNEIIDWIINNTKKVNKSKIVIDTSTTPYTVNYNDHIEFNTNIESFTNGMFQWGKVDHMFCEYNQNLTSLKGAPKIINKDFDCMNCEKLTSLKGLPNKIGGTFSCNSCPSLKTLEGLPNKIGVDLYCYNKNFNEDDIKRICDVKRDIYC